MLPGFHAVEHSILLFSGHAIKSLQGVTQLLLPQGGKIAELRIAFKRFALLLRGQISVFAQPLTGVGLVRASLVRAGYTLRTSLVRAGYTLRMSLVRGRRSWGFVAALSPETSRSEQQHRHCHRRQN